MVGPKGAYMHGRSLQCHNGIYDNSTYRLHRLKIWEGQVVFMCRECM